MRVSVSVLNVEHVLLVVRCTWRAHRRGAYEAMFAVLFTVAAGSAAAVC